MLSYLIAFHQKQIYKKATKDGERTKWKRERRISLNIHIENWMAENYNQKVFLILFAIVE